MGIILWVILLLMIFAAIGYYLIAVGYGVGSGFRGKSIPIWCEVKEAGGTIFDEAEFLKALQNEIEKQIKTNGATVIGKDAPSSNRIHVEYQSGKVRGRIGVSGGIENSLYKITADLEERPKRRRFANDREEIR